MGSWARWNLSRRRALYNLSKSMHSGGIKTRRSARQYSTSIVVATFIFLLTFLAVLPVCCRDLPYSQYFHKGDDLEDRVMALNDERLQAAERHLSALDADESRNGYLEAEGGELDLVIAVVTVRRVRAGKTLNYLTQVGVIHTWCINDRKLTLESRYIPVVNFVQAPQQTPQFSWSNLHVQKIPQMLVCKGEMSILISVYGVILWESLTNVPLWHCSTTIWNIALYWTVI